MPPLRDAALVERCDRCDQIASARCRRCHRPACADHAPSRGRRCADCEAELDRRLAVVREIHSGSREVNPKAMRLAKITTLAASGLTVAGLGIAALAGMIGWQRAVVSAVIGPLLIASYALLALMFYSMFEAGYQASKLRPLITRLRFLRERPGGRLLAAPQLGEEE